MLPREPTVKPRHLILRQRIERVVCSDAQRREMAQIAGQYRQLTGRCGGGDSEVGESGALAFTAGAIGQRTGHAGGGHIKRQNVVAIKMEDRLQPSCQSSGFAARTFTASFGYAISDFGDGDS
jgi:hypothetical protein